MGSFFLLQWEIGKNGGNQEKASKSFSPEWREWTSPLSCPGKHCTYLQSTDLAHYFSFQHILALLRNKLCRSRDLGYINLIHLGMHASEQQKLICGTQNNTFYKDIMPWGEAEVKFRGSAKTCLLIKLNSSNVSSLFSEHLTWYEMDCNKHTFNRTSKS